MEKVATARVIFGETDAMGIVYYANYLKWFEMGRAELMRRRGLAYLDLTRRGVHLPVTRAEVRYLSPARYDDVLAIRAEVRGMGRASVTFGYRIEREDGTPLADGSTVHAFTDADGRVVRVPPGFPLRAASIDTSGEEGG